MTDKVAEKFVHLLRERGFEVDYRPGISREGLIRAIKGCNILVFRGRLRIDKEIIEAGSDLVVLARYGIGLDNVDVDLALKKGIAVVNAPNASCISVAELAIGLLISVFRNIYALVDAVKRMEWPKGRFTGRELYGKKLGVIGFGRIGSKVAEYARALGMNVLFHDIRDVSEDARRIGAVQTSLENLLKGSDAVTVHVQLTPLTYHMLNERTLSMIPDNAVIVNTSRGEVIDTKALLNHLDRLGGVALDVLEQEPPKDEIYRKLIGHPKVIVTPHIGAETAEAMDRIADELLQNIMEAIKWL
ncbi:MAG: 3-phosphoglycerate dehydrogenase [Thermoproteota archaeon]|uniref:3-phosphoglycerate dehydrogenase n=1 Tax=Candidatus Methanodesulfokora washburnensis TaxID=2478471 RepID=A0A3R9R535_9CREN|nr:D-2-hydroxyacid dehydrogenase [Candidatus Methanodesulfokores washburnensis]RSN74953.1 3-phosphoglycerate dehydrogenase [Candidatus Methanodesulfokores washburnensis]RZN63509.1 MAG: 3-phosphoglycerate dehydrogenase [Candidatus Methanodesulfokores washburnensis]TDA40495.1 MAG: 3-phosphoglycerate dehydrogenase [Candidatus Korarchaeota archaeon]